MKRIVLVAALLLSASFPASAQEAGAVGIAMGYPANVALVWQVSDQLAIQPDFTFTHFSLSSPVSSETPSGTAATYGIGARLYTSANGNLRTYIAPRYAYGRGTTSSNSTTTVHAVLGAFGAQYAAAPRFSVYGQVGVAYTRETIEREGNSPTSTSKDVGIRSGVGVIFYFK